MSDNKVSKNDKISREDVDLWKSMTEDVKRLRGKAYVEGGNVEDDKPDLSEQERYKEELLASDFVIESRAEKVPVTHVTGQGLDRRTEERLRKGQMEVEARFDMHGFTQDAAHSALKGFIQRSYSQKKRCVLVITGKGKTRSRRDVEDSWMTPEPGVLKRRTPEWLCADDMKPYILKFVSAHRKDGGDGALYVLLRRHR